MGAVQWAGTVAAALIAIGTLLRWTLRRLLIATRWASAVITLPETVHHLSQSVETLTTSVDTLSTAVERLQNPTPSHEETFRVPVFPL
jgi:hypothetical protein